MRPAIRSKVSSLSAIQAFRPAIDLSGRKSG